MMSEYNGLIFNVNNAISKVKDIENQEINDLNSMNEALIIDKYPGDISDNNTRDGSDNNPYVINSIEDLIFFSYDVDLGNSYEGKTIELGRDLDFNELQSYTNSDRTDYEQFGYSGNLKKALLENGFKCIGATEITNWDNINFATFKGFFNGNKHKIKNLKIKKENNTPDIYNAIGFFASNYGTIKNLYLENANLNASFLEKNNHFCAVGTLVGVNKGTITNCSTSRNCSC